MWDGCTFAIIQNIRLEAQQWWSIAKIETQPVDDATNTWSSELKINHQYQFQCTNGQSNSKMLCS